MVRLSEEICQNTKQTTHMRTLLTPTCTEILVLINHGNKKMNFTFKTENTVNGGMKNFRLYFHTE